MLRRCDRYVLREVVGPFALALAGLILFILLNIILSLSDLMVDRGIGMLTLLRLVALKMPSLLVIAVPMSALFATFLGIGRLAHDREVVALESIGIPLRRVLLPLILTSVLVGAADFAIYNWGVPASEHAYQEELRGVIFRQGVPRITANAFFKGADNQFFYIRRYDEETGTLQDVHIYDTTGRLFPHAESSVTIITADTGRWTGDAWRLEAGRVYGFDLDGLLVYAGQFDELLIPLEQSVEQILAGSRTPAEMGISELAQRIAVANETGQRADEYVVEAHLKGALPLATVVFVLLGGALSLAFNPRSRAAGVVLGLLLVGLFQGALWWTQTLGRRGAMNPALAAWLPDLILGAVGLFLFLRVDRLANRDLWSRWRSRVSWLACLILFAVSFSSAGNGDRAPIDITCDELFLSEDRSEVHASGSVQATYEGADLRADQVDLSREEGNRWRLEASGDVRLETDGEVELEADRLVAELAEGDGALRTRTATATGFSGRSAFVNSLGEEHQIRFRVDEGSISFDEAGEVSMIDARCGEVTTCDCCSAPLREQPYTLSATRLLLYPDRLLVAIGLTARVAGRAVFWLPFYVQPLEETLESPLFPAFGQSALRGFFVKWNLPFFLSEDLYGAILIDYFSRFAELGLGGVVRYTVGESSGKLSVYSFPAKVGDGLFSIDLEQSLALDAAWKGTAGVAYERLGEEKELSFSSRLEHDFDGGRLTLAATRETTRDDETTSVEERIPEVTLALAEQHVGSATLRPEVRAGWIREWEDEELLAQRVRLSGRAEVAARSFRLAGLTISPEATADLAYYGVAAVGWDRQESLALTLSGRWEDGALTWRSTFVHGSSPFEFDRLEAQHRLDWRIEASSAVDVRVSGALDLAEGLEPMSVRLAWRDAADWIVETVLDPKTGRLDDTDVRGSWISEPYGLDGHAAYDWSEGRFEEGALTLRVREALSSLSFSPSFDLNVPCLTALDVAGEHATDSGWGVTLDARFEADEARFTTLRFGIYRDIADCLRVGVERDASEFWVYASITAFPEAVLRYAPRASRLDVGG
jgi:LPS export ABC transporter permease LptG